MNNKSKMCKQFILYFNYLVSLFDKILVFPEKVLLNMILFYKTDRDFVRMQTSHTNFHRLIHSLLVLISKNLEILSEISAS